MIYPGYFDQHDPDMLIFVTTLVGSGVSLKSALMEWAARKNGVKVKRFGANYIFASRRLAFWEMDGVSSSHAGKHLLDHKDLTRRLLRDLGYPVVESRLFGSQQYAEALSFAKGLQFPVAVKPRNLSRGVGVTANIRSEAVFRIAWEQVQRFREGMPVLVERHFHGDDYRFFVVGDRVVSVTARRRGSVTGNGRSSVLDLIQSKNAERRKNVYLSSYPIPTQLAALDGLTAHGIGLDHVLGEQETVILRSVSNLSAGGDSVDVTDSVHFSYLEMALSLVKVVPGMNYLGIDFLSKDIGAPATEGNCVVGELEFSSAPLSHFPLLGRGRDMAGAILNSYRDLW